MLSGKEAEDFISVFVPSSKADSTTITGKSSSIGGIVKARARVITRDYSNEAAMNEQMAQMQQGDILVSETTEPAMIEAIRKAGAIVTDIGGMLSHAAITARELGIPCVIATEVASKIIKDGDHVEVDADSGVVRILEKA